MTTADQVIAKAIVWLGTTEHPDGSNNVPGITDWYGIRGPWCAMSVSRIFSDAKFIEAVNFSTSKGFAYTPSGVAGFKKRGQWHDGKAGVARGDVIFFDWPGGRDGAEHVAIVESSDSAGVHTLEGNSNNRYERRIRNANILGYGRPKYARTDKGGLFMALTEKEEKEILTDVRKIAESMGDFDKAAKEIAGVGGGATLETVLHRMWGGIKTIADKLGIPESEL